MQNNTEFPPTPERGDPRNRSHHGGIEDVRDDDRPTRLGAVLPVLIVAGFCLLYLSRVGELRVTAGIGIFSAGLLGILMGILGRTRERPVGALASWIVVIVAGAGILTGIVGSLALLFQAHFPAPTARAATARTLEVLSQLGIVVGLMVAVFGVVGAVRNSLTGSSIRGAFSSGVRVAFVPCLTATAIGGLSILFFDAVQSPEQVATDGIFALISATIQPGGGTQTHIASLLLLIVLTGISVRSALRRLPVAEILADSGLGSRRAEAVEQSISKLDFLVSIGTFGLVFAFLFEVALIPGMIFQEDEMIRTIRNAEIMTYLRIVSTSTAIRIPLLGLLFLSGAAAVIVTLFKTIVRYSTDISGSNLTPYLTGAAIVLISAPSGAFAIRRIRTLAVQELPEPQASQFQRIVETVVELFGGVAIALGIVTIVLFFVVAVTSGIVVLQWLGYVSSRKGGFSLGAAGLIVAATFIGTTNEPIWLFVSGIVGGLVLWDVGDYSLTLGRELGRKRGTRKAEVIHYGGSVVVGLVGAGIAILAISGLTEVQPVTPNVAVVGFVAIIAALVFSVLALR